VTWEDAWREGRTGWDAGAAAPALLQLLREDRFPRGRVLVTGCGSGYDALALAERGREVVGLDLAPTAAARFEVLRKERDVAPERARVAVADFFAWDPPQRFDAVWDYTFLCALLPSLRHRWGSRMGELVRPGGAVLTLVFPMVEPGPDYQGPPFPLFPRDVAAALPGWEAEVDEEPQTSHAGREGKERLLIWRRP
jgi:SAM-dependent methyltransferase